MVERVLVILVNISWQLVLIFTLVWLMLAIFRIRTLSVKRTVWLAVVLCPLVLIPMNVIPSDIWFFSTSDFEKGLSDETVVSPQLEVGEFPDRQSNVKRPDTVFSEDIRVRLPLLAIIAWAVGTGLSSTMTVAGYIRLRRLISKSHRIEDEKVVEIFDRARRETGISRRVRLLVSSEAVAAPFSVNSCVVLPERMLVPDENLRMVSIHELVHLKHFDDLINLFCRIVGSFMFFHPLFHLAVRELRFSSEQICDGWATELTGNKEDYASCLVELARLCAGRLPICFCENRGSIVKRVRFILNGEEGAFKMVGKKKLMFLSITVLSLILMVSAIRLVGCVSDKNMQPTFVLKGTVRDATTGKPITGAKVSDGRYGPEPRKGAITDSDGNYSYLTWYEEHNIEAQAPGYETQRKTLMTKLFRQESEKVMDFELVPLNSR